MIKPEQSWFYCEKDTVNFKQRFRRLINGILYIWHIKEQKKNTVVNIYYVNTLSDSDKDKTSFFHE